LRRGANNCARQEPPLIIHDVVDNHICAGGFAPFLLARALCRPSNAHAQHGAFREHGACTSRQTLSAVALLTRPYLLTATHYIETPLGAETSPSPRRGNWTSSNRNMSPTDDRFSTQFSGATARNPPKTYTQRKRYALHPHLGFWCSVDS
jgi:hypothetical protein